MLSTVNTLRAISNEKHYHFSKLLQYQRMTLISLLQNKTSHTRNTILE
jgi:hypothetical protein